MPCSSSVVVATGSLLGGQGEATSGLLGCQGKGAGCLGAGAGCCVRRYLRSTRLAQVQPSDGRTMRFRWIL